MPEHETDPEIYLFRGVAYLSCSEPWQHGLKRTHALPLSINTLVKLRADIDAALATLTEHAQVIHRENL